MSSAHIDAALLACLPCVCVYGAAGCGKSTQIRRAVAAIKAISVPVSAASVGADDITGLCQLLVWSAAASLYTTPSESGDPSGAADGADSEAAHLRSLKSRLAVRDSATAVSALAQLVSPRQRVVLWLTHAEVLLDKQPIAWHVLTRLQQQTRRSITVIIEANQRLRTPGSVPTIFVTPTAAVQAEVVTTALTHGSDTPDKAVVNAMVREVQRGTLGTDLRAAAVASALAWARTKQQQAAASLEDHVPSPADDMPSPARPGSIQAKLAEVSSALANARLALAVGHLPSGGAGHVRTAEDELPYYAKWLVLAGWLAKSVPPDMDVKLLTPGRSGTKRRRQTVGKARPGATQRPFTLERLLAVYYALVAGAHGPDLAHDALTADGIACVRLLERIGVLHRGTGTAQGGRWTAAIGWTTAQRVARKLDMHDALARWAHAAGVDT